MDKIAALLDLKSQLDKIDLEDEDMIALVKPFLLEARKYGFTRLRIEIPFPSFNDGDPCEPYVSEYIQLGPDPEGEDLENYVGSWAEECFEGMKAAGQCAPDALSPEELQNMLFAVYRTFEALLELGKSPSAVSLTFTLDGDRIEMEGEDNFC